jgi:hypothetical protein
MITPQPCEMNAAKAAFQAMDWTDDSTQDKTPIAEAIAEHTRYNGKTAQEWFDKWNMEIAAIMTASIQNTPTAIKHRIGPDNPFWSQAYADVCRAVDREMRERQRAEAAEAALNMERARNHVQLNTALNERDQAKARIAELEAWKESALAVTPPMQEIAKELGLTLGTPIHEQILPGIVALKARAAELESELAGVARWVNENCKMTAADPQLPIIEKYIQRFAALEAQVAALRQLVEYTANHPVMLAGVGYHGLREKCAKALADTAATAARHDARVIAEFVEEVERAAEQKMLLTGKLEGAHYAAMKQLATKKGGQ